MHCRRRAPELSATSRLVSICIIGPFLAPQSPTGAALPQAALRLPVLQYDPSLVLGDRSALLDPHHVADLEGIVLVVRVELLRPAHGLLQEGMGVTALHLEHDGLGVLVGNHYDMPNQLRHDFSFF